MYDLGFNFESMPKLNTKFHKELDRNNEKKIHNIIDESLDDNLLEIPLNFLFMQFTKKSLKFI